MAKTAPYPPCTVTAFWLRYQDSDRCLRRVTLTKPYRRAVSVHLQPLTRLRLNILDLTNKEQTNANFGPLFEHYISIDNLTV